LSQSGRSRLLVFAMKPHPANNPTHPPRCTNGGDYVAEGMAVSQHSAVGAVAPVR